MMLTRVRNAESPVVAIGDLALDDNGAFKIGPFGSLLKKAELAKQGIPVAGIENVLPNRFEKGFRRFITEEKFNQLANYAICKDDILVTTMGTIGRAAVAPDNLGKAIFDSHLFRMRVDVTRVLPEYLCYAINSDLVIRQLVREARGAIMEGLNTTILRGCSIPLPTISKQASIVAVLTRADRMRRARRHALQMCDELLPSAFLESFGDWATVSKHYPIRTLEEVVDPNRIVTYGIVQAGPHVPGGVPYIKTGDIVDGVIRTEGLQRTSKEIANSYKRSEVVFGDLVMSIRATVGTIAVLPKELDGANLTQGTARIAPRELDKLFLLWQIRMPATQLWIKKQIKGTTFLEITLERLREMPVFVPPTSLQQRFATTAQRCNKLRQVHVESVRQADHLFKTLLHQAFTPQ